VTDAALLCVFADCPNEGTLVPVVELQAGPSTERASCVLNGTICAACVGRVNVPEDLVGAVMLMEIECALAAAPGFGGIADPDLTRLVFVPVGQMLTPMQAPGEG
jgi:hypothetical protein